MYKILILGAGKVGTLVAGLLANTPDYLVYLADKDLQKPEVKRLQNQLPTLETFLIDVNQGSALADFLNKHSVDAVISALPYFCNIAVAKIAKQFQIHYFDLTEDVATTQYIKSLATDAKNAFIPQCGLAPGFVGIVANNLMQLFDQVDAVKMRVGALPQYVDNAFHYALTWSTEGLINQYIQPCHVILNSTKTIVQPLQGLETIIIDGKAYEAFYTSGGIGSMDELCESKVNKMNYKTLRYPGHCEKIRLLLRDLKLKDDPALLKQLLEKALPRSYQDLVIIYVAVNGYKDNAYLEEFFIRKVYPQNIFGMRWTAIQIATASSLCVIVDLLLKDKKKYIGFIYQEQFSLTDFLTNPLAKYLNGN